MPARIDHYSVDRVSNVGGGNIFYISEEKALLFLNALWSECQQKVDHISVIV